MAEDDKYYYMEIEDSMKFVEACSDDDLIVNLLPVMDPYIMGYKERERIIDCDLWNHIFDRSGNATSTILINGKIRGVWDFDKNTGVKLHLLRETNDEEINLILEEAKRTASFLGSGKDVKICDKMTTLNERTAGGFMSPLNDN